MTDIRQSKNYAKYLESQGWIVERIEKTNYFIKSLTLQAPLIKKPLILGSFLKIQRPNKINFEIIQRLENKYRVFQTIIEPVNELDALICRQYSYKLSKSPYLPSKTIQIDLTQSIDSIFRNFSKNTRYSIKRGESVVIKECSTADEIRLFYNAWKKSVNFNRYVPSLRSLLNLKKSFPQSSSLFLTSHNKFGDIIGGALFTTSSHEDVSDYITFYWYGFTNKEGRTSLSQYSLLYQGILWAKRHGSKVFDFEGIYDERFPNKTWLGFTHFKKSFGGKEALYPGCYTKFRFPV